MFPGTGALIDLGSGSGHGYTINLPVPSGADDEVWLSLLEHVIVPVAPEFDPELVLISAGFDAHRADPLGDCLLEALRSPRWPATFAICRRGRRPCRGGARGRLRPGGAGRLRRGDPRGAQRRRQPESIAPDPLLTSRAAAHVAHFWTS